MRKLILLHLISLLSGCATADPTRNWVKEFNTPYNSLSDEERIADEMEKADYVRYSREAGGVVNKNFSSTPADYLEREFVYYKIGLEWMNRVQYASFNCWIHRNLGPAYCADRMKQVPEAKAKMGIYMRKLMELPNLHRMSRFLIARMQELDGYKYSADIKVQHGAMLWIFTNNPGINDHTYLLEDFTGQDRRISSDKKGGSAIEVARTVCAGMLVCAGGFRGDDELVVQGVSARIGLQIIRQGEYGIIEGEKPL